MPGLAYAVPALPPTAQTPAPAAADTEDSGFSFGNLLDIVNPLQHFPVISTIYRHLTGDKIGVPEKIAGDTLYGGLLGLASSLGDAIFEQVTGKNVGDTVYAYLMGDDTQPSPSRPATVMRAEAVHFPAPDFSGLFDLCQNADVVPADADTAQRAALAYRSADTLKGY